MTPGEVETLMLCGGGKDSLVCLEMLRDAGIAAESSQADMLFEPWTVTSGSGAPFRVFTPFWKQLSAQLLDMAIEQRLRGPLTVVQSPRFTGLAPAMSSTWMRLNTCPGLTIRRARPERTWSMALRPGP